MLTLSIVFLSLSKGFMENFNFDVLQLLLLLLVGEGWMVEEQKSKKFYTFTFGRYESERLQRQ